MRPPQQDCNTGWDVTSVLRCAEYWAPFRLASNSSKLSFRNVRHSELWMEDCGFSGKWLIQEAPNFPSWKFLRLWPQSSFTVILTPSLLGQTYFFRHPQVYFFVCVLIRSVLGPWNQTTSSRRVVVVQESHDKCRVVVPGSDGIRDLIHLGLFAIRRRAVAKKNTKFDEFDRNEPITPHYSLLMWTPNGLLWPSPSVSRFKPRRSVWSSEASPREAGDPNNFPCGMFCADVGSYITVSLLNHSHWSLPNRVNGRAAYSEEVMRRTQWVSVAI